MSADRTGTIGVDLAHDRDWTVKGVWELTEKLPGGGTAMPTQRWEGDANAYFTSAEIAALTATPANLRASLAKHGHVIFVLCLDENEERQRLHREGVDTGRIKFVVMPKVKQCAICGDLALYLCRLPYEVPTTEPRCQRHLRDDPSEDYNPMKEPPCES